MAYCKQCGAYLPDGQSVCLACGFDEKPKTGAASATQSAEKSRSDTERLRKQMEEQRARQQEQSRKWAEQEAQRRREQQERQRDSEPFGQAGDGQNHIPYARQSRGSSERDTGVSSVGADVATSKAMAIISYLSILCLIPLFTCKNDEFATFHAKQGLALLIFSAVGNIVGSFFGLGWLFFIAQLFFVFKGIGNANSGIKEPLPYIGTLLKF